MFREWEIYWKQRQSDDRTTVVKFKVYANIQMHRFGNIAPCDKFKFCRRFTWPEIEKSIILRSCRARVSSARVCPQLSFFPFFYWNERCGSSYEHNHEEDEMITFIPWKPKYITPLPRRWIADNRELHIAYSDTVNCSLRSWEIYVNNNSEYLVCQRDYGRPMCMLFISFGCPVIMI